MSARSRWRPSVPAGPSNSSRRSYGSLTGRSSGHAPGSWPPPTPQRSQGAPELLSPTPTRSRRGRCPRPGRAATSPPWTSARSHRPGPVAQLPGYRPHLTWSQASPSVHSRHSRARRHGERHRRPAVAHRVDVPQRRPDGPPAPSTARFVDRARHHGHLRPSWARPHQHGPARRRRPGRTRRADPHGSTRSDFVGPERESSARTSRRNRRYPHGGRRRRAPTDSSPLSAHKITRSQDGYTRPTRALRNA